MRWPASIAAQGKPVLRARFVADDASLAALRGKRVLAFAGIGDPVRFFNTLSANGIEVVRGRTFADHHAFSQRQIDALLAEARRDGLIPVTTEKDLARLPERAGDVVPFKVTLAFDDAERIAQVRERAAGPGAGEEVRGRVGRAKRNPPLRAGTVGYAFG